ncbi:SCO-spondin-like isoform X1 [Haliotis rufescens]|uniref:SCO-spondin-like isoform X1 n=1 Tax=Haliotis rufescens TaxID=6454 RepID=UPI00201F4984|nr:SCO-spondin-like isoform X1 [Haliotis rufescens]
MESRLRVCQFLSERNSSNMKYAVVFAVLLVVVLQEAYGASCPKSCTKHKRSNCRYYYYYRWGSGYSRYYYCSSYRSYTGTCYEPCTHGGWSNWSDYELYEECPVMCGGSKGLAFKTRSCTSPAPTNGGNDCDGDDTQEATIACNTEACGDRCPADTVKYHAHQTVAHNYYQCDPGHQKAFLKNCTDGTVFNVEHHTCVHANAEHGDCFHGQMAAHPTECGKFLSCVHGQMNEMPCPGGLHYNRVTKTCDWPTNANCETQ